MSRRVHAAHGSLEAFLASKVVDGENPAAEGSGRLEWMFEVCNVVMDEILLPTKFESNGKGCEC